MSDNLIVMDILQYLLKIKTEANIDRNQYLQLCQLLVDKNETLFLEFKKYQHHNNNEELLKMLQELCSHGIIAKLEHEIICQVTEETVQDIDCNFATFYQIIFSINSSTTNTIQDYLTNTINQDDAKQLILEYYPEILNTINNICAAIELEVVNSEIIQQKLIDLLIDQIMVFRFSILGQAIKHLDISHEVIGLVVDNIELTDAAVLILRKQYLDNINFLQYSQNNLIGLRNLVNSNNYSAAIQFNEKLELIYSSISPNHSHFNLMISSIQNRKYLEHLSEILSPYPNIIEQVEQLTSSLDTQSLIKLINGTITIQVTRYGSKVKLVTFNITYIPVTRTYAQLLPIFKRKVRLLFTVNRATQSFISKQLLLTNRFWRKSQLVTYLPDADDLRDQLEHIITHKPSSRYEKLLKSISIQTPEQIDPIEYNPYMNIWDMQSEDDKIRVVNTIFQQCQFFQQNAPQVSKLYEFICVIRHYYNHKHNHFHNFNHGLTVMSGCFVLAHNNKIASCLDPLQQFCLVFSGLCHDVDHTGKLNLFEINSESKLALRYNDRAVLENHHASQTFRILSHQSTNIFEHLETITKNQIRKYTINNILATDNKTHFTLLQDLEVRVKQSNPFQKEEGQLAICGFITHTADFFGAVKEYAVSRSWSEKLKIEFQTQYELEGKLKIAQTPFLKDLDNQYTFAKNEVGFLKVIVKPLWDLINNFTGGSFQEQIKNIENNIITYEKVVSEEQIDQA